MKPMKAAKFEPGETPEDKIIRHFPLYAQVKLDGIRMVVRDGIGLSNSLKPIRNQHVQSWISHNKSKWEGLDGELILGDPTDPLCYTKTMSEVMSFTGSDELKFHVFDRWDSTDTYANRAEGLGIDQLTGKDWPDQARLVASYRVTSMDEIYAYQEDWLEQGHEGIMLRHPNSYYKFGRGTLTACDLVKIKKFEDLEGVVFDKTEEMHNANEAETNNLGHTQRSGHQDGLIGKGTVGALWVRGVWRNGEVFECKVGSGFTAAQRAEYWNDDLSGRIVKFKYFPIGNKDKPRHGIFLGFRDPDDMSTPIDIKQGELF